MLVKDLIEFGLNEKEAKAYLALLELEVAGVQEISKAAGINRSSAYITLEALKERGLVSISDDKKVRRYVATSPDAILRTAEDMVAKQERIQKKISAMIPEMKALYKGVKKKPIIQVYEGKQGLINCFEETLKNKEKLMRVWSAPANLGRIIYEYLPGYISKRLGLGIKMIGIHPDNGIHKKMAHDISQAPDENLLIPSDKYNFTADLAIYDDKISYMSSENDGLAVIIESKEISEVMKSIFDLAWEEAKRLSKGEKKS